MSAYSCVVISVYDSEAMSFENLCICFSFDNYAFKYKSGWPFNGILSVLLKFAHIRFALQTVPVTVAGKWRLAEKHRSQFNGAVCSLSKYD